MLTHHARASSGDSEAARLRTFKGLPQFAFFFLAEYANIMVVSTVGITLFFGGWLGIPGIPLPGFVWFVLKLALIIFVFIWLRATLPRYRYDQLMSLGWKFMFPLVIINIFLTGLIKYLFL